MITATLAEYKEYNPTGTATQSDLNNASAIMYSYTNYTKTTDQATIDIVKQAIYMFADYDLDNGIASGVAKNEMKSVSIDGFSYSQGGSKVADITKAKMPPYITAILAPTGLLYRGIC